jgi:hypothetical protein
MNYNKLLSKLPIDSELHYLSDTDSEYQSNNHNYILFEYTTDWFPTLSALKSNNIDFTIKTDSNDLDYILI